MDAAGHPALPAAPVPPPVPSGRRRMADKIAQTLSGRHGPGALIVGGPGTGKTTLARCVLDRLGARIHTERVRGGPLVSAIPYGAIHYLLSDVDTRMLDHPIHVVSAAGRLLRARAGGRKIVVFADNAQLLDDRTAATLSQLAADGTATLLLCAEDACRIPASFDGLGRNGLLHRFDIGGFTFRETAEWLGAGPGAPACGQGTHELWTASGGNPLLLGVLAHEWQQAGLLLNRDGTWVMGEGRSRPGGALDAVRPALLEGLAPGQQALADILAMMGSLPMELVCRVAADADFDELRGRGIVVLESGPYTVARMPDRLVAELLRRRLVPERSRELLATVLEAGGWEVLDRAPSGAGAMALSLAQWVLDCRAGLAAVHALAAARTALDLGDPALCLRLAQQAAGQPA
ncbi:AAA family ATPase, partial [Arthrobacter sp. GCM10027362]|uniref:AAA family ATPase n=1 Tax=Arthrobacter sp. GCM10027362 TaxID=3273379 RepID=UPI0036441134